MPKADFLVLHYRLLDILFARDLFFASTFRNASGDNKDGHGSQVLFGDHSIPDFDLDSYVRALFPGATGAPPLLGAVCRTDVIFTADNRPPEIPKSQAGSDLISLAIPSDSDIRTYDLSEFKFMPYNIREGMDRHGIRALRFNGPTPQFFCDAHIFVPASCSSWKRRSTNIWYFRDARVFTPPTVPDPAPRRVS
ncbi:MAG: hypothetical protein WCQ50_09090 [Spirochaetota bacterium]